jgi:hypothetical protein
VVVELEDLAPVGVLGGGGVGVDGVDGGLELVRTRLVAAEATAYEILALVDQRAVPEVAVLVGEADQRAVGSDPGRAAGLLEEHQGEQTDCLGLVRHQLHQQATETQSLGAQFVADEAVAG